MDVHEIVAQAALVVTLMLFSSGIPFCINIIKTRTVPANVPFMQFLLTDLNNLAYLYYGYLKWDMLILRINFIGAILQKIYMLVYIIYNRNKAEPLLKVLVGAALSFATYAYMAFIVVDTAQIENMMGLLASVMTTVMVMAPVVPLMESFKSQDTSCISVPLTLLGLCCSGLWLTYGMMLNDFYIMAPNFPGMVLNLMCLYMVLVMPNKSKDVRKLD